MERRRLTQIEQVLARMGAPGRFAAHRLVPAEGLSLSVKGVGAVELPITAEAAQDLCAVAKKAPFGRGRATLVDEAVRDTWQIDGSRVRLVERGWSTSLAAVVEKFREALGLPARTALVAELDKMLVYTRGQFFLPHQDTEKTDGMLGTLLVVLPSKYTGGQLRIAHGGRTHVVKASKKTAAEVTCIAFYADCRHEVTPLQSGHRVVLSYNLVVRGAPAPRLGASSIAPGELASEVERYFTTPKLIPRFLHGVRGEEKVLPDRLVYLLDHEYTKRGLGWGALKNGDAARAEALHAAAATVRCGVALALAEVHESWECVWDDGPGSYRSHLRHGAPTPDYLIESSVTLEHVVDPDGRPVLGHKTVARDEWCETTASASMDPDRTEYEPYMGNYGNTEDRWYRRGAVVLWPRDREFLIRAKSSSTWAMGEVARCLRARDTRTAKALARELVSVFQVVDDPKLFALTLDVAVQLGEATVASRFLDRFTVADVAPSHADLLAALLETYGLEWCQARIVSWFGTDQLWRRPSLKQLTRLCEALYESKVDDAVMLAAEMVQRQWAVVRDAMETAMGLRGPSHVENALKERFTALLEVLESRIFAFPETSDDIGDFLAKVSWPPLVLADFLGRVTQTHPRSIVDQLGISSLFERCRSDLEAAVAAPERAEGDWSIHVDLRCTCELCCSLSTFLADPTRQEYVWPLAKERRRHVHGTLVAYELPVTHETIRTGSPYKLELIKTRKLFSDERARRSACVEALATLSGPTAKPKRRRRK